MSGKPGTGHHLDYRGLLPATLWAQICDLTATPTTGTGLKADMIRCLLFERLSGLPASRSPFATDSNEFRGKLAAFPRQITPNLMSHLDQAARQFLDDRGLTDEPLTWQPSLDLLDGLDLPGSDPSSIDVPELHRLIRSEGLAFSDAAERLGTTIDAVRYILETEPAPGTHTPARRGRTFAAAKAELPEATLIDLYQRQGHTHEQIACKIGCNENIIARLARLYGIPARTTTFQQRVAIERDWLYEQHVTHRRTLTDIGREVGLSVSHMSRRAKAHEIPVRPSRGRPHARHGAENTIAADFPILRPALSDRFGWDRLQRFAIAAEHPSLGAASQALGTHKTCLFTQIKLLERDLGGPLLIRASTRYQPMQLTLLGTKIVNAVRKQQRTNDTGATPARDTESPRHALVQNRGLESSRLSGPKRS